MVWAVKHPDSRANRTPALSLYQLCKRKGGNPDTPGPGVISALASVTKMVALSLYIGKQRLFLIYGYAGVKSNQC
jgi:hypothetical protein